MAQHWGRKQSPCNPLSSFSVSLDMLQGGSLLDCKTKVPLFSSWRESSSLPTCEQKRLTHPFGRLAISLEMFYKTEDTHFTSPLHLPLYSAF